jgi:hypothetical protein
MPQTSKMIRMVVLTAGTMLAFNEQAKLANALKRCP